MTKATAYLKALPEPPDHLQPVARAEWRRTGRFLVSSGQLAVCDLPLLESYCAAFARLRRLETEIASAPLDVDGKLNPLVGAANQTCANVAKLVSLLGAAPSTRSRLPKDKQPEEPADDPSGFGELLKMVPRGKR